MPDSSKPDHWGSLASNLGAKPETEDKPSPQPAQKSEPFVEAAETTTPEISPPDLPAEDPLTPAEHSEEFSEAEQPPLPDFLEAVRREAERAEAVQKTEWPMRLPDEGIDLAHDAGESFRTSPEPPLELTKDDDEFADDQLIGADADAVDFGEDAGEGDAADKPPEEKKGRKRRRRRGRRGGRSGRDEAKKDEAKKSDTSKPAATETIIASRDDGASITIDDVADDDDDDDATLYATDEETENALAGSDRPKHRNIPTWPEAIRMIVDVNLEARSKSPNANQGRGRGRRGGRRRGRSSSK